MKATNDLTVGKPLHVIILFAFPIFVGNIFQQLYNIVDTVVVGHVMGDKALAAVGAASVIYMLFISLANITIFFGAVPIIQLITGTKEAVVLETASRYMRINVPFYYILSILLILRSTLQGVGRRIIPLAASSVELILKFVVVGVLAPMMGYLGVCISEPMIWIVCSIMVLIDFYVTMNKSYKI